MRVFQARSASAIAASSRSRHVATPISERRKGRHMWPSPTAVALSDSLGRTLLVGFADPGTPSTVGVGGMR